MGKVYIILSRSNTLLARFIRLVTKKYYNHASLSFDRSLETFYSFGRLNPKLMFPAGFITEGVKSGYFGLHPGTKIMVLERELPEEHAPDDRREMLRLFHEFTGFLPFVSHGIEGVKRRILEGVYGTLLGMAF